MKTPAPDQFPVPILEQVASASDEIENFKRFLQNNFSPEVLQRPEILKALTCLSNLSIPSHRA